MQLSSSDPDCSESRFSGAGDPAPLFCVRVVTACVQQPLPDPPYHGWPYGAVQPEVAFHRAASGYLVRFQRVADFRIDMGAAQVECIPDPRGGNAWRAVYQQQVIPLLKSARGELIYHGGAVAIGSVAIALLGPSGRGKSTLVTALAASGLPFLGDDCLMLRLRPGSTDVYEVVPDADSIRLWEDSARRVVPEGVDVLPRGEGMPKPRVLAGAGLKHCAEAMPLARAYALEVDPGDEIRIEPIGPADGLVTWASNAFVLDPRSPTMMAGKFEAHARLLRRVPIFRLSYPRRFDRLDAVVRALLEHAAGSTPSRLQP